MALKDISTILEKLDRDDQNKVAYFIQLLIAQEKYRKLQDEIIQRREEIRKGESLKHDEVWNELDV